MHAHPSRELQVGLYSIKSSPWSDGVIAIQLFCGPKSAFGRRIGSGDLEASPIPVGVVETSLSHLSIGFSKT